MKIVWILSVIAVLAMGKTEINARPKKYILGDDNQDRV